MRTRPSSRPLLVAFVAALTLVVGVLAPAATADPVATVTGMSPSTGPIGSKITITGTGFSAPTAVVFTGATVQLSSLRYTSSLGVTVPAGVSTGPVSVQFADGSVSAGTFTVTTGILVGPRSASPGSKVSVKGSGFGSGEVVAVSVGGAFRSNPVATSTGTFGTYVTIPGSAPLGPVSVTASGATSGATATTTFTVGTDWPSEGADAAHTRSNPFERDLTPATVGGLAADWTVAVGNNSTASPVVAGGRAYLAGPQRLRVVDATTGAALWSAAANLYQSSTPAVAGGVVYFTTYTLGTYEGSLVARDAATGAVRWTALTTICLSSPVVANGVVYIGDEHHHLTAFDAATGVPRWQAEFNDVIRSSPAVVGGVVYVGGNDGLLRALDAATGRLLWTFGTQGSPSAFVMGPAVVNGIVYAKTNTGTLYALRATNGKPVWSAPVGAGFRSAPAVAGKVVYIASDTGTTALDATTGAVRWTVAGAVASSPSVADGVVYVGASNGVVRALDAATGAALWSQTLTSSILQTSPAVGNGRLYVGSSDGAVSSFSVPS